jgi:tetratricopeptide (TPR) repeat protein
MKSDLFFYSLVIAILLGVLTPLPGFCQNNRTELKSGNKNYESNRYSDAETHYRKAVEVDSKSFGGNYNLGNSIYKQDRAAEAEKQFRESGQYAKTPEQKSKSLHNLGNSLLKQQKYQEAIDAYKQSLRLNPSDADTRYNLAYAQSKLQAQQQNQQNKDQQKQDEDKKEGQKDKQNPDGKDKQENKNQEQQQNDKEGQDNKEKQQGTNANQDKRLIKEEAERMLKALQNDEKELQKKMNRKEGERIKIDKQW